MRPAEMPAGPQGVSFSRTKDIVKSIENLVEVKLTTKITEKSALIFTLVFRPFSGAPTVRLQRVIRSGVFCCRSVLRRFHRPCYQLRAAQRFPVSISRILT